MTNNKINSRTHRRQQQEELVKHRVDSSRKDNRNIGDACNSEASALAAIPVTEGTPGTALMPTTEVMPATAMMPTTV